jgi:hypothetical protein
VRRPIAGGRPDEPIDSDRISQGLAERQREPARTGGHLEPVPLGRAGEPEDVAAALGCAESTVSNLLRKAEASVMRRVVGAE